MAHKHRWHTYNDILVCAACGATKTPGGYIFDPRLANMLRKGRKRAKKNRNVSGFHRRTG